MTFRLLMSRLGTRVRSHVRSPIRSPALVIARHRLAHARSHHLCRLCDCIAGVRSSLVHGLLPAAVESSQRLGPRCLRAGFCDPEFAVGRGPALRGRGRRPLRRARRDLRRHDPVRDRPPDNEFCAFAAHARSDGRCVDRLRPVGMFLQSRGRGARQTRSRPFALVRIRRRNGGRLVRAIPVRAIRRGASSPRICRLICWIAASTSRSAAG
jgi:hypothetical protein